LRKSAVPKGAERLLDSLSDVEEVLKDLSDNKRGVCLTKVVKGGRGPILEATLQEPERLSRSAPCRNTDKGEGLFEFR
jgi:hypothetical protein